VGEDSGLERANTGKVREMVRFDQLTACAIVDGSDTLIIVSRAGIGETMDEWGGFYEMDPPRAHKAPAKPWDTKRND